MWPSARRRILNVSSYGLCYTRGYARRGEGPRGGVRGMRWFGIPVGLGLVCLAALQLQRTLRRERRGRAGAEEGETSSWQLAMFRLLPARLFSRRAGSLSERELPLWLRGPLLGLYVRVCGCDMSEAVEEEVTKYRSLSALFTRSLKPDVRPISREHSLVCPADGRVLHMGTVDQEGRLEQIKGVSYILHQFLGQQAESYNNNEGTADAGGQCEVVDRKERGGGGGGRELHYMTIYLSPGDYHGFHSPANWRAHTRRHFPGELITVAPWAVKTMPGLFNLNERVLLLGQWEYGFFSFAAVGATIVGSISLTIDEELRTNQRGKYVMGQFSDQSLPRRGGVGGGEAGMRLGKGQKLGTFKMGSTIVLVFQAPEEFEFCVGPGDSVLYGQPLGHVRQLRKTT
ncbi:Phosphatidylserine decarboxylase proenzyme, mitochondrial [Geodia barretti]|uniref:Phosphatidylserine decarboxylase proenzyme, mitochondrial n=1 Tax=Geodia barretti TaxID=519541 RepID=A0AA35S4X0_GEOBA|nr:Phosphatidylserine decarboxylase proenzyme, mitochondrial [Geodia barretti]